MIHLNSKSCLASKPSQTYKDRSQPYLTREHPLSTYADFPAFLTPSPSCTLFTQPISTIVRIFSGFLDPPSPSVRTYLMDVPLLWQLRLASELRRRISSCHCDVVHQHCSSGEKRGMGHNLLTPSPRLRCSSVASGREAVKSGTEWRSLKDSNREEREEGREDRREIGEKRNRI